MYAARAAVAVARQNAAARVVRAAFVPALRLSAPALATGAPSVAPTSAFCVTKRWQSQDASAAKEGMSTEPAAEAGTRVGTGGADAAAASGAPGDARDEQVKSLQSEMTKMKAQLAELSATRLRLLAEMENVRTIARRDVDVAKAYAITSLAKRLVDVADNLNRAVDSVPAEFRGDDAAAESGKADAGKAADILRLLYDGVSATERNLLKTLGEFGIEPFGKAGEKFDPNRHEAMLQVPIVGEGAGEAAGDVAQVLKVGFKIKDRVLRPAQVAVRVKP